MKLRMFFIMPITICFALLLCACEPAITGLEIVTYPDKLFYVISIDEEINLDGGTVQFTFDRERDAQHYAQYGSIEMNGDEVDVLHDINFTKEGVYIVTIRRHTSAYVSFPIQVVSLDTIENIITKD